MDKIAVNTYTLASDIESLQTELNMIKNDMDKMYDSVRLLDSMWDGPANAAFNEQFNNDQVEMMSFCETIQKVIDSVEYARKEYDNCEMQIGSKISSFKA